MKCLRLNVLILSILFSFCISANALSDDRFVSLPETDEYEEISALIPTIIPELNAILQEEGFAEIDASDINLADAYQFFVDENFFASDVTATDDFLNLIDDQEYYIWYIPIQVSENEIMVVGLGKGHPLREDLVGQVPDALIEEIKSNVGKWSFVSAEFMSVGEDFASKAAGVNNTADQIILVNPLTGTSAHMAVYIEDNTISQVMMLSDAEISLSSSDAAAINTLQDDKPQELLFSEGEQYTFTQMQNLIGTLALSEDGSWGINSSGGASFIGQTESTINTYGLIIGGVAVVIGSIALLYFKKYHKKCPRHKTGQHN